MSENTSSTSVSSASSSSSISLTGLAINNAQNSKPSVVLNITNIVSQAQDITEDYGKICKNLYKGTSIHEDLLKVAKEFANTETHMDKTEMYLREMSRLTDELEITRVNMMKSFGSVVKVNEQLDDLMKSLTQLEKYKPSPPQ